MICAARFPRGIRIKLRRFAKTKLIQIPVIFNALGISLGAYHVDTKLNREDGLLHLNNINVNRDTVKFSKF